MAKTQAIEVSDELRPLFNKTFEQRDRFVYGVLQGHKRILSRRKRRELSRVPVFNSPMIGRGSLFRFLAPLWGELNPTQKNTWRNSGQVTGLTNWQLFISDNAARIRHSLTLSVPPSDLWQVKAGHFKIEAPASEIILKQDHPLDYWEVSKVRGQSWKRELVLIRESFGFPLTLALRYKSDLTAEGPTQSARFFARIWTSYQGQDIETDVAINLNPSTDWTFDQVTVTGLKGYFVGYTLFFEIKGYRGELLFDNIEANHSGQNWARDMRCNFINQKFTKAFALVSPYWQVVSLPEGSSFLSVYPPSLS